MSLIKESMRITKKILQKSLIRSECSNFTFQNQIKVYGFQTFANVRVLYIFIFFYLLVFQANCIYNNPISGVGPFYTESFQINNVAPSSQTLNFTFSYGDFTFTSSSNPIPNDYVSISIVAMDVVADNGYLTFGISTQTVYQTSINLGINFCQTGPTCFKTVTFRMLAIDYDFLQGGTSPYDQVKNSMFITTINVVGVNSFDFTYTPQFNSSAISSWTLYYIPYIRGFRLKGPSIFSIIPGTLTFLVVGASVQFTFNLTLQQSLSGCQAEFQMILINKNTLSSKGRLAIPIGIYISTLHNTNQINYNGPTNIPQYASGENLALGLCKFYLNTFNQLALNTIVTSTRQYQTDSANIFGSSSSDYISMQYFVIQKTICSSATNYYLSDIDKCSDTCPYYIKNLIICSTCSALPTCITCNATSCITCDPTTRNLTTTGQCAPLNGYYQNNQTIASPCCGNCSICSDSTSCDVCNGTTYFFEQSTNQCLQCTDIFAKCALCAQQNPGVTCQNCDSGYFFYISQCLSCVPNCTICIDANSCSSCIAANYFYLSASNQCLLCQDIFPNCLTCGDFGSIVICSTCNTSYFFNSTLPGCELCMPNCLSCVNTISCDSCATDYFYQTIRKQCLLCQQIFPNCLSCITFNSTKIVCQLCNSSYYIDPALPGCQPCVQNCTDCSNASSCNECQSVDYFYWNRSNKCLLCLDIYSNCLGCSNSSGKTICSQCNDSYFFDSIGLACTPCVQNCTGCVNNKSCNQCVNSDYFYWIPDNKCLLCPEIYMNCVNCSENSTVQYGVQCVACEADHILIVNSTYQKCSKQCGDSAIQGNQSCDDGNMINQDGCNNLCEIQQNFTCLQVKNKMYPDFNTSHCIYTSPIEILQTYLQKMPSQNKVEFRFNFYPKLAVFDTIIFDQTIKKSIEILWNGCMNQTLTAYKIPNGLQQNGLFGISFLYNQQWTKIQAMFIPQNTGLCIFTQNCNSTRFLQQQNCDYIQQQGNNIKNRKLQSLTVSTPLTIITLPQKSSNNLEMFSDSYSLYTLTQYITFFLIGIVWIYWLIGLFYGKIVVLDFMITLQLILLCSMTVGLLNPGFAGMMSDNFVFLCFINLFKPSYETRPIYENIDLEFKSANISYHAMINLNLMVFLVLIVVIIGIIAKILEKVKKEELQKRQIFQTIFKYCFGQFLFYVIMPFSLNGSLSSILYIKTFIKGGVQIQFSDILSLLVFNALIVFAFVLFILSSKNLGQFRSQFLRFDISQQFYFFTMIYTILLGYIFGALSGTSFLKYFNAIPVIIFVCVILFAICKMPYLQKRHMIRVTINNGIGIILMALILVQNFIEIDILKLYLSSIIVIAQIILAIVTGYFLYLSVKVEGVSKFHAFLFLLQEKKNQVYQSVSAISNEKQEKIYRIGKTASDYYLKQSKLLNNIKINTQPSNMPINYSQAYQNLQSNIPNEEEQPIDDKIKYNNNQENKNTIVSLLKNSKLMKMSLKEHLVDQNSFEHQEKQVQKMKEQLQKYVMKNCLKQTESSKVDNLKKSQDIKIIQQYQQNCSEELISNYNISQIITKKNIKKQEPINIKSPKVKITKQQQESSQQQQIKSISYDQWARKIEEQDELKMIQEQKVQKQQQKFIDKAQQVIIEIQQNDYESQSL